MTDVDNVVRFFSRVAKKNYAMLRFAIVSCSALRITDDDWEGCQIIITKDVVHDAVWQCRKHGQSTREFAWMISELYRSENNNLGLPL
jgi:hypothetical protein